MANGKGNEQYGFKTDGPNGEAAGTNQRSEGMTVTQYMCRELSLLLTSKDYK